MSRSPNLNTSWLPLWSNTINTSTSTVNSQEVPNSRSASPVKSNSGLNLNNTSNQDRQDVNLTHELPSAPVSRDRDAKDDRGVKELKDPRIPLSQAQQPRKRKYSSSRPLRNKGSTASLASMTAGNWLGWSSKGDSNHFDDNNTNNNNINDNDDDHEEIHDENEERINEEDDDYVPDDNGDEIDDQVGKSSGKKTGSSSWNFWNSSDKAGSSNDNSNSNNKEKEKEKEKPSIANTILSSTPSLPNKQDLAGPGTKHKKLDRANDEEGTPPPPTDSAEQDDAVLYKPHDKNSQFKQINTHKNENLRENVIVPDWNSCLPAQSSHSFNSNLASTLFGNSSTSNQNNSQNSKIDLKNWRNFLNQLSSKLGFSSQSLSSVVSDGNTGTEQDDPATVEKEFNLLYEKTYRLYGRSLEKLPPHKKACLPNYNKFYTSDAKANPDTYKFDQQTQLEEDINDPNSISISNDPLGNLLINHRTRERSSRSSTDVVSYKSGPLKKIKKILIIGVHGFFPTKMIRPLIGSPKGTSLKFANEAEKAVIRYCIENNMIDENESNSVSIQKIALEKEGKIFDRVDFFTKILQKWQNELNECDFIFIAAHSQGCVVSIILFAKLISLGILKDPIKKRIGILGMAGINNGPFYGIDKSFLMKAYSAIENDSLAELFDLTKFTSQQSLVYKESIQIVINANVKICFIGSINDQLVPLYSAMASHVFHPNIYRACYIDHSSQTPLFIQKLVSLCCHLQNLGYFDNNVLKELSTSLSGSMTGGGHSKIYNDGKVYDLGIKFVLDTDDIVIPATPSISKSQSGVVTKEFTGQGQNVPTIPSDRLVTSGVGTYGSVENQLKNIEIVNIPVTNQVYIKEYNVGKIGTNPFILPWCLRGLLFNIEKNWPNNNKLLIVDNGRDLGRNGYDEINELYDSFEDWRPDSKVLKELKFRLNGLRASKL